MEPWPFEEREQVVSILESMAAGHKTMLKLMQEPEHIRQRVVDVLEEMHGDDLLSCLISGTPLNNRERLVALKVAVVTVSRVTQRAHT